MTAASSAVAWPATLCPPPRTAIGSPSPLAQRTAAATSSVEVGRMTTAGRRSIVPLKVERASS